MQAKLAAMRVQLMLLDQPVCSLIFSLCILYSVPMGVGPVADSQCLLHFIFEQPAHLQVVLQMLLTPLLIVPLPIQHMPARTTSQAATTLLASKRL